MEELILSERKLKENLVQAINNSKIPAFIVKPILKDLLQQVDLLEQEQYEKALKYKKDKENSKPK